MADRRTIRYLAFASLALLATAAVAGNYGAPGPAPRFDYYVLSLSWSPSYCVTHSNDRDECNKGFGFVLHGLWPQYRNGRWPQHCHTDTAPDRATVERTLAFMPSRRLIEHEWQAHGACSGLDPASYFDLADRAFASVAVPEPLRAPHAPPTLSADGILAAFTAANPGLQRSMMAVVCRDGGDLSEVRLCLNKDSLAPQACGAGVRSGCRHGTLTIPAVR